MLRSASQCFAVLRSASQCFAVLRSASQCFAVLVGELVEPIGVLGARPNGRFAPFAAPKGFKDVIAEVEEGVEV